MVNKIHRFFLVISIFVLYQGCFAIEIQEASGSYRFGPDVSRKEGCHEAKKIAKANALEEYSSEFLLSDREIRCHENDLDASCEFTKSIYSFVGAANQAIFIIFGSIFFSNSNL